MRSSRASRAACSRPRMASKSASAASRRRLALSPKWERLRHHDRMPAEDARIALILIAVRDDRIIERIGAGGLGRGGRRIECRRAQRRVELPAGREHALDRRAQGRGLHWRGRFTGAATFCGLPAGLKRWSWAAAEAWPAARIMASAAAPAKKRDDMEMTSNPGRALAEENACLQARWMRRNAIQRRAQARCFG